jgi:hypothetical protein
MNNFFGEGTLDIIKNPFEFQNIEEIHIHSAKSFGNKFIHWGGVRFSNGNTKGEQKFYGDNLSDVFTQVYNFCNQLSNK